MKICQFHKTEKNPYCEDCSKDIATEELIARRSATACSAGPDAVGFWWWRRIYKTEWEMVKIKDFGDGTLTAYPVDGDWGGWSLNVSPERFAGDWVKISPPNASVMARPDGGPNT